MMMISAYRIYESDMQAQDGGMVIKARVILLALLLHDEMRVRI